MLSLKELRRRYLARRSNPRLVAYLKAKARLGLFDERMCAHWGVSPKVNKRCKRFICRAYKRGLVPTSTTGGKHAAGSYHPRGMAVDVGGRRGDRKAALRKRRFQEAEFKARTRYLPIELIGPINNMIILKGQVTSLTEGSPLEEQHDDHVHGAFPS